MSVRRLAGALALAWIIAASAVVYGALLEGLACWLRKDGLPAPRRVA